MLQIIHNVCANPIGFTELYLQGLACITAAIIAMTIAAVIVVKTVVWGIHEIDRSVDTLEPDQPKEPYATMQMPEQRY